jgi:hypothetical protein
VGCDVRYPVIMLLLFPQPMRHSIFSFSSSLPDGISGFSFMYLCYLYAHNVKNIFVFCISPRTCTVCIQH